MGVLPLKLERTKACREVGFGELEELANEIKPVSGL